MISEELVDSAAMAVSESRRPGMWEHEPEQYKDEYRRSAMAYLEAAAPLLMAQAWEEGRSAGFRDAWVDEEDAEPNPYRIQSEN